MELTEIVKNMQIDNPQSIEKYISRQENIMYVDDRIDTRDPYYGVVITLIAAAFLFKGRRKRNN